MVWIGLGCLWAGVQRECVAQRGQCGDDCRVEEECLCRLHSLGGGFWPGVLLLWVRLAWRVGAAGHPVRANKLSWDKTFSVSRCLGGGVWGWGAYGQGGGV